jgi:hypothetical protein
LLKCFCLVPVLFCDTLFVDVCLGVFVYVVQMLLLLLALHNCHAHRGNIGFVCCCAACEQINSSPILTPLIIAESRWRVYSYGFASSESERERERETFCTAMGKKVKGLEGKKGSLLKMQGQI